MESLKKAFDILEIFLTHEGELGLSEIARISDLNISTVHGLISFLRKKDYIIQKGKRGKYTLGYKFLEFGDAIIRNLPISDLALPYMKELNGLTDETVTLAILHKNIAMIIYWVESSHGLRVAGMAEREAPLHGTGVGKVLLAYQTEDYFFNYSANSTLKSFTSNTITDPVYLKEHLQEIKNQGYAIDNQETELGVINIAAPVRDRSGKVVAAIGILGPSIRITDSKIGELVIAVKGCTAEISRALGYKERM